MRFKKTQVALIEEALNEADFMDSDEEYRSRCDKMTNFETYHQKNFR